MRFVAAHMKESLLLQLLEIQSAAALLEDVCDHRLIGFSQRRLRHAHRGRDAAKYLLVRQ